MYFFTLHSLIFIIVIWYFFLFVFSLAFDRSYVLLWLPFCLLPLCPLKRPVSKRVVYLPLYTQNLKWMFYYPTAICYENVHSFASLTKWTERICDAENISSWHMYEHSYLIYTLLSSSRCRRKWDVSPKNVRLWYCTGTLNNFQHDESIFRLVLLNKNQHIRTNLNCEKIQKRKITPYFLFGSLKWFGPEAEWVIQKMYRGIQHFAVGRKLMTFFQVLTSKWLTII